MPKENETEETQGAEDSTSTSPWDSDLEEAFEDEDVRQKVSDFLGSKVQPYVTKVEQEARPSRDATRLWDGFEKQPVETSIQVVTELYGSEIGGRFADLLEKGSSPEEAAAQVSNETDVDVSDTTAAEEGTEKGKISFDELPPEVQNAVAAQEQEKQREAYYEEIERIKTEKADDLPTEGEGDEAKPVLDVDLFHPFVVAANGDFDAAAEAYLKFVASAKEQFGIKVPENAGEEEGKTPPPAINSETKDASATPPQSKEGQTLDEALDDFFAEQKAPPPTVGTA